MAIDDINAFILQSLSIHSRRALPSEKALAPFLDDLHVLRLLLPYVRILNEWTGMNMSAEQDRQLVAVSWTWRTSCVRPKQLSWKHRLSPRIPSIHRVDLAFSHILQKVRNVDYPLALQRSATEETSGAYFTLLSVSFVFLTLGTLRVFRNIRPTGNMFRNILLQELLCFRADLRLNVCTNILG